MPMTQEKKYRLVTKYDFDGLICAVLLKYLDMIDEISFVHPRDVANGKVEITCNDIIAGLPYTKSAYIVFDNYPGSKRNAGKQVKNFICDTDALSTAKVIYKHFGGKKKFPKISKEMMVEVDKGYSAHFNKNEILYPSSWGLLNYLIDQRTGLEKFKEFKVPLYQLMMNLVNYCKGHSILEILDLPEVEERIKVYFSCIEKSRAQILRCATVYYNLVVIDMRKEKTIYPGNRFIIYALFPECNVSLQVLHISNISKTVFAAGKSIIDRSYKPDIGRIMSEYGGGGHANAGGCQVINDDAHKVLKELIQRLKYSLLKNMFLGYFN